MTDQLADSPRLSAPSRYQTLFDRMDQGFCVLQMIFDDADQPIDYRYIEVNRAFEQQLGMSGALGRTVREIAPAIEAFWFRIYGNVALTGESTVFENYSKPFDRWFDVNAFRIGEPHQRQVAVIFRDITDRKRREAHQGFLAEITDIFARQDALEDVMSQVGAKLGAYLDLSSCVFCEVDEARESIKSSYGWRRDGEPNLMRTYRISEYLSEAFLEANRAGETVLVSDTQSDPRTNAQSYASLNIYSFLTVPHHQGGTWKYYLGVTDSRQRHWRPDEVQLIQALSSRIFSHLDQALSAQSLRESEARFRLMADAVPQIVWIMDRDGMVTFLNRQWTKYTGRPFEPRHATVHTDALVHPDDLEETLRRLESARHSGQDFQAEYRLRSADGHYRWFLGRAEPHRDENTGEILRWFGAAVDIHDRKMAEQAMEENDRRKDEFLATLAHELRNPLAPIRTGLALLGLPQSEAKAAATREMMERQLGHMVRLIDDLLDISRINSNKIVLKKELLDLGTLFDSAIEVSRPAVDAGGHQLFVSVPSQPVVLEVDVTRMAQVVSNLLSNAAKYTPNGGRIELSAQREGAGVAISVADDGVGIAPEALARVFDLFSQFTTSTDRSQGGLGIGLALVKRLVEMHGGRVAAESDGPGQGSRFTVWLPVSESAVAEPEIRPEAESANSGTAAMRILVVDDNVDAALSMRSLLEVLGHDAQAVHSGPEALAAMEATRPQVVFLDIGLPGMDGHEVARQVRRDERMRSTTLIALTGWGAEQDLMRTEKSGFDHHLTKPVDGDTIVQLLRKLTHAEARQEDTAHED